MPMWKKQNKTRIEALKGIRVNEFKNCFEWRKIHLNRGIASNGKYFEGD